MLPVWQLSSFLRIVQRCVGFAFGSPLRLPTARACAILIRRRISVIAIAYVGLCFTPPALRMHSSSTS